MTIFVTIRYKKSEEIGSVHEPYHVDITYKDVDGYPVNRSVTPRNGHLIVEKGAYNLKKGYNSNTLEITGISEHERVVLSLPMSSCIIAEIYKEKT